MGTDPDHGQTPPRSDADRSERISYWLALTIALAPIPAAMLISWVLGDPPWRARPRVQTAAPPDPRPHDHGGPARGPGR